MLNRAYAVLEVKSVDAERRRINGVATTPTPDRLGDVIDPLGATYLKEIPLLLHHKRDAPVGVARLAPATATGIAFEAEIPIVDEPGPVKDDTDRAWTSILHKLIRGVSIGFRPRGSWDDAIEMMKGGGLKFLKTEILELSLVTIPAQVEATLAVVKSFDTEFLEAATGRTSPGDAGTLPARFRAPKVATMTVPEQITQFENTRAAKDARKNALMADAATAGVTLDQAQTEEYDTLADEVRAIDAHLVRLRALEQSNLAKAAPVPPIPDAQAAARHTSIIQVKANLPPATAFVRYCQALAVSKGSISDAIQFAKRWEDSTPEVGLVLKAAVAAGTTTDATWAGPLVQLTPLASEFLELLRPATILGKVPGFRRVPFNVSVASQTGGGTYQWVGQGAPKPVGKLTFGSVTLGITKCAGIVVITLELARTSNPSAEAVIRQDMINGIAAFLDLEFTDPTKAAVANVSPGSVTNGVTPITTAGTTPANARTDIGALINAMTAAGISAAGAVLIMSETNALALSNSLNALGQPLFPSLGVSGGTAMGGIGVITSQAVGNNVILVQPDCILYADDGGVTIDASTEASVQMDSAPDNPALATTILTSLWQNNLVGLRAERFINWKKARTGCVQYTVASYVPA